MSVSQASRSAQTNDRLAVPSYLVAFAAIVILAVYMFKNEWLPLGGPLSPQEIAVLAGVLFVAVIVAGAMSNGWNRDTMAEMAWPQRAYVWLVSIGGMLAVLSLVAVVSLIVLVIVFIVPVAFAAMASQSS